MTHNLTGLLNLPGVEDELTDALANVDKFLWDRQVRATGQQRSQYSTVRGAFSSARTEGIELPWDMFAAQTFEASPMGEAAARILALYQNLPNHYETIARAPLQVLANLATIVTGQPGAPRADDQVNDPLGLKTAVPAAELPRRLRGVADVVTAETAVPALLVAAIAHAELATTVPFTAGSGVVARSITRLVLANRGVDPDVWTVPEEGIRGLGRAKYVRALQQYAQGDVGAWVRFHSSAVSAGVAAARTFTPEPE